MITDVMCGMLREREVQVSVCCLRNLKEVGLKIQIAIPSLLIKSSLKRATKTMRNKSSKK